VIVVIATIVAIVLAPTHSTKLLFVTIGNAATTDTDGEMVLGGRFRTTVTSALIVQTVKTTTTNTTVLVGISGKVGLSRKIVTINRTPTIVAKPLIVMDAMTPTFDTTRTDRMTAPILNDGTIVKIDLFDTTGCNQYFPHTSQTLRIPTNRHARITIHNRHKRFNQIHRNSRHNRYSRSVIVVTATIRTPGSAATTVTTAIIGAIAMTHTSVKIVIAVNALIIGKLVTFGKVDFNGTKVIFDKTDFIVITGCNRFIQFNPQLRHSHQTHHNRYPLKRCCNRQSRHNRYH
jgi:hypothetical protein